MRAVAILYLTLLYTIVLVAMSSTTPNKDESILRPRRRLSVVSTNKAIEGIRRMSVSERKDSEEKTSGTTKAAKKNAVVCFHGESKRGYAPYNPRKRNQDSLLIKELDGRLFLGTLDGHGEHGHFVSRDITDHFCATLGERISAMKSLPKAMEASFLEGERNVIKKRNVNTDFSGTTNVTVCVHGNALTVLNVGDSRAIVGSVDKSGRVTVSFATEDQKPDTPAEKARIIKAGGRVFAVTYDDGVDGPARMWLGNMDVPGLAMARSYCDCVAHSAGVISEGEVYEYSLRDDDEWLIIATDGLWEFYDNKTVLEIVGKYPKTEAGCKAAVEELIRVSNETWLKEEQVIDDTTIIVAVVRTSS